MSADTNTLHVLGEHTLLPELRRNPEAWRGTILEASGGRIPPYLVVCGDRRRVRAAAAELDGGVLLADVMERRGLDVGRVEVAVGSYKGTPIAVVEHGMGCPTVEIIVRELLSNSVMTTEFPAPGDAGGVFRAASRIVIRAGSAGGINYDGIPDDERISVWDHIVCSHVVGISGTDLQGGACVLSLTDPAGPAKWKAQFEREGIAKRGDEHMPWQDADPGVRDALRRGLEAVERPGRVFVAGNFSKDSLYCEEEDSPLELEFARMREAYNVGSTEMEFCTLVRSALTHTTAGMPTRAGMAVFAEGTLPGGSFQKDPKKKAAATRALLRGCFEALHELSQADFVPAAGAGAGADAAAAE